MAVAKNQLPSREELAEIFEYDPDKGVLRWRYRAEAKRFNTMRAGKVAGCVGSDGRTSVHFTYKGVNVSWRAHRIIYKIITGDDPPIVDHRYGVEKGDAVEGLRAATAAQNGWNRRATSGRELPKNVYAKRDGFMVKIQANGQTYEKHGFTSASAAGLYARAWALELHGEFSASAGVNAATVA